MANNGNVLAGGKLYTYVAGSVSTPQPTYTDSTGNVANSNPVILDSNGEANVWFDITLSYKLVLTDSLGVIQWTVDNVSDLSSVYGILYSGVWHKIPSIFRLCLNGSGLVTIDSRDKSGNIILGAAQYTVMDAVNLTQFPFVGNDAVEIRATYTGDASAEVI